MRVSIGRSRSGHFRPEILRKPSWVTHPTLVSVRARASPRRLGFLERPRLHLRPCPSASAHPTPMSERRTGIPKTNGGLACRYGLGSDSRVPRLGKRTTTPGVGSSGPQPQRVGLQHGVDVAQRRNRPACIRGRYEITDIIGEGAAWAWSTRPGTPRSSARWPSSWCARTPPPTASFITRFRRELEITSQLRHPSTIRVFEHGETEGRSPVHGDGAPHRGEPGRPPRAGSGRRDGGAADRPPGRRELSEAHEHGVFHRDLKPDNIFIETVGVSKVVKVLDFGIAGGVDAARG